MLWHLAQNPSLSREEYEAELFRRAVGRINVRGNASSQRSIAKGPMYKPTPAEIERSKTKIRQLLRNGSSTVATLAKSLRNDVKARNQASLQQGVRTRLKAMGKEIVWNESERPVRVSLAAPLLQAAQ